MELTNFFFNFIFLELFERNSQFRNSGAPRPKLTNQNRDFYIEREGDYYIRPLPITPKALTISEATPDVTISLETQKASVR